MKKYQMNYVRIVTLLACFFIHQVINAQWTQLRGPMRDGFSPETKLLKNWPANGPKLLWSSDTIGDGFSSAIIHNKVIYITGNRDTIQLLTAIDLNGKVIWQKEFGKGNNIECNTPTIYRDKIYTIIAPSDICCIDSKTGEMDWKISMINKFGGVSKNKGLFAESPLVVEDKVIITPCGKNTTLVALNRITGETIWMSESIADTNAYASPVLVQNKNRQLIVTRTKNYMLAVDLNDGKIVWKEKAPTESYIILPDSNQVYFPNCKMLEISADMSSIETQWNDTLVLKYYGGAVKLGNRIFSTYQIDSGIFSLDWETGEQQVVNKGIRGANLLAADGMIYSYEDKRGRVSLLKPTEDNIEIVGSFKVELGRGAHLAHMSIGEGMLFVRHGNALMTYDIKQR